ncbi:MAG: 3-phosphoglycerate dehydrogenase [Roseibium sp.]|uniref:NAD(P)-dependent oxidoreductase n=1 Tax=Roseibium sp. TaxID=1936156 RepID=UPI002627964B|nr:NAD(P)-dependent oxidoreductase [Roseibium sp.]MCV0427354.1 3-phosphoglycerate dehydrogenase [Roseibium sp.]
MAKVLIAGKIHPDGLAMLDAETGLDVEVISDPGATLSADKLAEADALLIRYGVLTAEQAGQMPRLKVVSRHGVGCDNLPVRELAAAGVPVTIVGPVNAVSVAEQVMAMLMALVKHLLSYDKAVREGRWDVRDTLSAGELAGRKLMLLGFGRIGREVARRALGFDMEVWVHDPFVSSTEISSRGCVPVPNWRQVLPEVDALSLHLPLTNETKNLIGAAEFNKMKASAILLNAARGGLVDEDALAAALKGRMSSGGAGLDCFADEPQSPGTPLLSLSNVVVSPHSAALTGEAARRMAVVAANNVIAGLKGSLDPALVFNLAALKEAGHGL